MRAWDFFWKPYNYACVLCAMRCKVDQTIFNLSYFVRKFIANLASSDLTWNRAKKQMIEFWCFNKSTGFRWTNRTRLIGDVHFFQIFKTLIFNEQYWQETVPHIVKHKDIPSLQLVMQYRVFVQDTSRCWDNCMTRNVARLRESVTRMDL